VRTQAGKFLVEDATMLEEFKTSEAVGEKLINPLNMLGFVQIILIEDEYNKILNGQALENKKNNTDGTFVVLTWEDKICAMAQVDGRQLKIKKVFAA
jgi:tRNA U55 pseudouridine synthase TruB